MQIWKVFCELSKYKTILCTYTQMYTIRIQNSIYKTHAQFLICTLCIQIAFEIYHFLHKPFLK